MTEPVDDYYRELVKNSQHRAKEPELYRLYGDDDIAYRHAAYNLLTTGAVDCADDSRFQYARARIVATNEFHENPVQVQEGVIECPRCGSTETLYYEKQSRSADEAATIYCRCKKCGKAWKEN